MQTLQLQLQLFNNTTRDGHFQLKPQAIDLPSEWLVDDALTVKVKIELRPQIEYLDQESIDDVVVLPSTIGDKILHLLDTGSASDVAFMVQQEEIRAHSQILSPLVYRTHGSVCQRNPDFDALDQTSSDDEVLLNAWSFEGLDLHAINISDINVKTFPVAPPHS